MFCSPIAFIIPLAVSIIRGIAFPAIASRDKPLVTNAPILSSETISSNSTPYPKVPLAAITGFASSTPASVTPIATPPRFFSSIAHSSYQPRLQSPPSAHAQPPHSAGSPAESWQTSPRYPPAPPCHETSPRQTAPRRTRAVHAGHSYTACNGSFPVPAPCSYIPGANITHHPPIGRVAVQHQPPPLRRRHPPRFNIQLGIHLPHRTPHRQPHSPARVRRERPFKRLRQKLLHCILRLLLADPQRLERLRVQRQIR